MSRTLNENTENTVFQKMANAGIYSKIPEITAFLPVFIRQMNLQGFTLENAEPLDYGSKITVRSGESRLRFNLYFSKKKGFSLVPAGKIHAKTLEKIRLAFHRSKSDGDDLTEKERSAKNWLGSDEAGKGDFLGPLVTAAVHMTGDMTDKFRVLGVQDSKNLSLNRCREIAQKIFIDFKDKVNVVELKPETYNRLYADFKNQGIRSETVVSRSSEFVKGKNPRGCVEN